MSVRLVLCTTPSLIIPEAISPTLTPTTICNTKWHLTEPAATHRGLQRQELMFLLKNKARHKTSLSNQVGHHVFVSAMIKYVLWSCFDSSLVYSLGLSCRIPMRSQKAPVQHFAPSCSPWPSLSPFYSPSSFTFLFSHPYSLFLHIYISLFSEVCCSLILCLWLLPQGPEGGPLTQDWGLRDRLSQLKIRHNLDNSEHGRCTTHCLHQTDLEVCRTKTDTRICRRGVHITELEDQYSIWPLFWPIIHLLVQLFRLLWINSSLKG